MTDPAMTSKDAERRESLEPLLTLHEAANIIRRSHWSIRKYVASGLIQGVRIGRDLLIEPRELRRFIEQAKKLSSDVSNHGERS